MWRTVLVLVVACGGKGDPDPSAIAVQLQASGNEPRRALRYEPVARKRIVHLAFDDTAVKLDLAWERTSPDPIRYQFSVLNAEMDFGKGKRADVADIEKLFTDLPAGTVASDPQGRVTVTLPTPKWTAPSVPTAIQSLIVPLPVEAVGVGAKWRATSKTNVMGAGGEVAVASTNDYELVELTAIGARVNITGTSEAQGQKGVVSGTFEIKFDDLMPITGAMGIRVQLSADFLHESSITVN